jgi:hypothetical protein
MSVVVLGALPGAAFAASPAPEATGSELQSEVRIVPNLGLTVLAGLTRPACRRGPDCFGTFGSAPSLQTLLLYQPNETWAFGLLAQVERSHWQATATPMTEGAPPYNVETDVTSGFAGLAARFMPLPARRLSPVVQLAMGLEFQQTSQTFGCGAIASPAAQLGLGGRARVSSSIFVFAMASARAALASGCVVSDAPATPFAALGLGFHAGAAFDFAFGPA